MLKEQIKNKIEFVMQKLGAQPVCFNNLNPLLDTIMSVFPNIEEVLDWGQRVEPPVDALIYANVVGGWSQTKPVELMKAVPRVGRYLGNNLVLILPEFSEPRKIREEQLRKNIQAQISEVMHVGTVGPPHIGRLVDVIMEVIPSEAYEPAKE